MRVTSTAIIFLASLAPACGLSSYLQQLAGPSQGAPKPPAFVGKKHTAPTKGPGSYLDGIAGAASTPPPPPPPPAAPAAPPAAAAAPAPAASAPASAAPAAGNYLSSLAVASAPSGGGLKGYLDVLPKSGAAQPSGAGLGGYLQTLKVESASGGGGLKGYLDSVGGGGAPRTSSPPPAAAAPAAAAPAASSDTMISQEPVLTAINKLNDNMVKNQKATITVLHDINSSVKKLAEKQR